MVCRSVRDLEDDMRGNHLYDLDYMEEGSENSITILKLVQFDPTPAQNRIN